MRIPIRSHQKKLIALFLGAFVLGLASLLPGRGATVVTGSGTTYQTGMPTVPNWDTGWGASGITGWDYVGQVNGASGVYLGNGFVLTAGHVGAGDFTLGGTTYSSVDGSAKSFGTADLTLFQIASGPSLPSLTISSRGPFASNSIVITGYGGGQGKTWASNTVAGNSQPVPVGAFVTTDFYSNYDAATNPAQLVGGDSGGADFYYRSSSRTWELAGLNEAYDTNRQTGAYAASLFVQLSTYRSDINAAMLATAAPEPGTFALLLLPTAALLLRRRREG